MNIYISNLPFATNDSNLKTLFETYGTVNTAKVMIDRQTTKSRGFGFVDMNEEAGRMAISALNGQMMDSRTIRVEEARSKESTNNKPA